MIDARAAAALALFVGAYVLFVVRERYQLPVAVLAALVVVGLGLVSVGSLLPNGWSGQGGVLEWNTLGLLVGLFLFAALLRELGLFRWIAEHLELRFRGRPLALFLALVGASFGLSAFLNSISVLFVLASVTLEVAAVMGVDPVPLLIAEISAANAGGAATFVGDPPNVILGTYFQLSFGDFLLHAALPALAALAVVVFAFSRSTRKAHPPSVADGVEARAPPPASPPLVIGIGAFAAMLAVLAVSPSIGVPVWVVGVAGGLAALLLAGPSRIRAVLRDFDWPTLAFFASLFVLVGALVQTGVIGDFAAGLDQAGGGNLLLTGTLLFWSFGLLSSVVNNVPLAAAAAPLIVAIGAGTGVPTRPLVYAAALGSDIGGSGTPIGASANVVGVAVYRRAGVAVGWGQYLRLAFPVMVVSLAAANVVWLFVR